MWVLSQRLPLGLFVYHVCLLFCDIVHGCIVLSLLIFIYIIFFQFPCVHLSGCSASGSIQSWLNFSLVVMSCCSLSWSFVFIMDVNIIISSANRNVSDWELLMVSSCSAVWCRNRVNNAKGISFHRWVEYVHVNIRLTPHYIQCTTESLPATIRRWKYNFDHWGLSGNPIMKIKLSFPWWRKTKLNKKSPFTVTSILS